MADFSTLSASTNYLTLLQQISDRDKEVAMALDPANTSATNVPTNAVRYSSANKRWEKWSGSAWGELIAAATDAFNMSVTGLRGGTLYGANALAAAATLTGGAGSSIDVPVLKQAGSAAWTAATLTNLSQLTNGPGYLTSSALSPYALLASPTFSGTPAAPTAAVDTSTTQLATTQYVVNQGYLKTGTAAATYAPLTGGGASGTWGISITGSAAYLGGVAAASTMQDRGGVLAANRDSATANGFYVVQNTSDSSGMLTFSTTGSLGTLEMEFFYAGSFNFRNKTDGTTWTAWKTVLSSANYNSYAPTLTGSGASGTWGINISGTAAAASSVAWSNVSGRPTAVSAFTNDSGYINGSQDAARARGLTRSDSAVDTYNVQSWWDGVYWRLRGYNGSTLHAECRVGCADTAPWSGISGRPTTLSSFSNDVGYITGLSWSGVSSKPINNVTVTSSTSTPTGGSSGDLVFQY